MTSLTSSSRYYYPRVSSSSPALPSLSYPPNLDQLTRSAFVPYCKFAFAYFRIPDGLSKAVHITRWVAGLALIVFNWGVKTKAHHVIEDYGRVVSGDCFFTPLTVCSRWHLTLCTQSVCFRFPCCNEEVLWEVLTMFVFR